MSATFATGVARLDNRVRVNSSSAWRPAYVISQKECQAVQSESEQRFIHMFIHIFIHMVIHMAIHMAIHMVIHMNVDVFRHSNEGMKVCTFIHLSRCQDIWTHTGMDKWMYNWMSVSSSLWMWECLFILLYPHTYFWMLLHTYTFTHKCICIRIYIFRFEWMFIHRSHQVSLCASITMIVCKKISDYQSLPNISEIFPNISQLFYKEKTFACGFYVIQSRQGRAQTRSDRLQASVFRQHHNIISGKDRHRMLIFSVLMYWISHYRNKLSDFRPGITR